MSFARLHKWVTYLLSGLGLLALSLGSELPESALLLIALGYLGSYFAEGPLLARPGYASSWTIAVVGFLVVQVARGLTDVLTLSLAMEFAAFLQISRLWNRRTAADYQQIAVLSFLHLIAATVLSTNLSYAALFIGFVIATPWMLALSHLRREIEGNYPSGKEPDSAARKAIDRVLASKRVVGPGFLLGTALLSVPLFAMTLVVFVTIPRVGQGFLSLRREQGQRVAGFSNQIELGGFGVIRDDPTVVVRVIPEPRVDERAPRLSMRLRGTAFDFYDGKRWTRAHDVRIPLPNAYPNLYPLRRPPDMARDKRFKVVLDHLDEPVLFVPEGTIALSIPPRVVGGRNVLREVTQAHGLDLRYDSSEGIGLVYTAFVSTDRREADVLPMSIERREEFLQLPLGHQRVAELAKKVIGDATTSAEKIARIEQFLKRGEYRYSLQQPQVGAEPPLIAFLFGQKVGHCEYFATAMVIMLRAVGIPARNVTGFVGGRYNPYGGYYALRQGDAHSWVEAYQEDRGFVTYDPTPTARAEVGPAEGAWADVNALLDALRTRWATNVVGYDMRTQLGMLQKLAAWARALKRSTNMGPSVDDSPGMSSALPMLKRAARSVGALLVIGVLLWLIVRTLSRRTGPTSSATARRAVSLYAELERALGSRGQPRAPSVTPLEHARALRAKGFEQAAEVEAVTDRYLEARFGGKPLRGAEIIELRMAIARIKKAA